MPISTLGPNALASSSVTRPKIGYAGAVLQVQNTYGSSTVSISNSGSGRVYSDLLTIAFTPVSASNKIVVIGTSGQTSFTNRSSAGAFGIVFNINNTVYDFGNYPWYNASIMYPIYPPDITITRSLNVPTGSTFNIKLQGYSYNESSGNITSNFISYQLTVLEVAV